jgi:tRNA nucleotidyltransferase (CCA-adding enzyme)
MDSVSAARRGHPYPSVRVLAADLVNGRVVAVAPEARVDEAMALALRRGAAALTVSRSPARAVLREDLQRAAALGLGALPARRLARPLPVAEASTSEAAVRRQQARGAPLMLVREGDAVVGSIDRGPLHTHPGPPMAKSLMAILGPARCSLLSRVGTLAELNGGRAFAVGGVVRDALRGEGSEGDRDLDVAVEGDGRAVARLLAAELGATLVEHDRFLTASVRDRAGQRVDVATARAEHYSAPGALPRVRPAGIEDDLGRRDFTVNAMAAELSSGSFLLIDPLGGQRDLRERRLRVLHPLSFVEDPTRILRAARYEARLGLRCDAWTAACRALALACAPFPALSGARVLAELELVLREPRPAAAVDTLGTAGALHLLDRGCRYTAATAARARDLTAARAWAQERGLPASGVELLLLALLGDQPLAIALRALARLGVEGEPCQRLVRALEDGASTRQALVAAKVDSLRARLLRGRSAAEVVWLWLAGDDEVRAALTRTLDRERSVRPWLDGDEVVALGIPQGPQVRRLLEELRDGQLDGTILDRAAAERYVRRRGGRT